MEEVCHDLDQRGGQLHLWRERRARALRIRAEVVYANFKMKHTSDPSPANVALLRGAYAAFNARDIDPLLARMLLVRICDPDHTQTSAGSVRAFGGRPCGHARTSLRRPGDRRSLVPAIRSLANAHSGWSFGETPGRVRRASLARSDASTAHGPLLSLTERLTLRFTGPEQRSLRQHKKRKAPLPGPFVDVR